MSDKPNVLVDDDEKYFKNLTDDELNRWLKRDSEFESFQRKRSNACAFKPYSKNYFPNDLYLRVSTDTLKRKYNEENRQELDKIQARFKLAMKELESRDLTVPWLDTNMDNLYKYELVSIIRGVNEVLFAVGERERVIGITGKTNHLKKKLNERIILPILRESFISMVKELKNNISEEDQQKTGVDRQKIQKKYREALEIHARTWYAALRARICSACGYGIMVNEGDKKICKLCGAIA